MISPEQRTTALLNRLTRGDGAAADELLPVLYSQLKRLAVSELSRHPSRTLQATALVHDVWVKLADAGSHGFESRAHFLGVAAKAMRSILIDHARARRSLKRGGAGRRIALESVELADVPTPGADLLAVDEALTRLGAVDPFLGRLAEMRLFGGLEQQEIACALDSSLRSIERGWRLARAWLQAEIKGSGELGVQG